MKSCMKKISGFLDREDFVCPVRCVLFQTVDLEKEDIKIMRKNNLFKKTVAAGLVLLMIASLAACDGKKTDTKTEDKKTETKADKEEDVELQVFIAASLNTAMTDIAERYEKEHPNVKIVYNADSSGTLLTQIEEGAACDVFFSAAVKQMDQLDETDGLVVDGTRHNVVNNQVCLVTYKGSNTEVTSLEDLNKASSIALADGSVPVGKYTRQALVNAGILEKADDVSTIPTATVSEALGGVEINECANVGAVTSAVAEGSNEVGTVYYSDTYGLEDRLEILQVIPYDLTGDVIYPVAQVQNLEAEELESTTAKEFIDFLITDDAKTIFQKYYFDTDVEN